MSPKKRASKWPSKITKPEELPSLWVWHVYSSDHWNAARLLCMKCADLEANPRPPMVIDEIEFPIDPAQKREHRSYAMASILSSVAFLEASLNELLASASDDYLPVGGGRGPLTDIERQALYDVRGQLGPPFLNKFQRVLTLLDRQPFDTATQPYQDTDTLVKLRNMLVHAIPARIPLGSTIQIAENDIQIAENDVLKILASKNFALHPFADENSPFFPDKCLGAACAKWAENTARTFADEFFSRLGVTPAYAAQSGSPSSAGSARRTAGGR